jgi:hypothetical protein
MFVSHCVSISLCDVVVARFLDGSRKLFENWTPGNGAKLYPGLVSALLAARRHPLPF